jgi:hypothetical protein
MKRNNKLPIAKGDKMKQPESAQIKRIDFGLPAMLATKPRLPEKQSVGDQAYLARVLNTGKKLLGRKKQG